MGALGDMGAPGVRDSCARAFFNPRLLRVCGGGSCGLSMFMVSSSLLTGLTTSLFSVNSWTVEKADKYTKI